MTDFHAIRRRFIGSSDAPILWGHGYESQSLWTLWDAKVNGSQWVPTAEEQRRLDMGNAMEPIARAWASVEVGADIVKCDIAVRHVERHYIGCHCDGEHRDEHNIAVVDEFKWVGGWQQRAKWYDDDGLDAAPIGHWIQVQHQLACTGYDYALLWGLWGDQLLVRKIDRDEQFIGDHIGVCETFWSEYVLTGTPPPVDGSRATQEAITRRWPKHKPETVATLPADADDWSTEIERLDEQITRLSASREELRNKLRAAIGDAEIGVTPGGAKWQWKTQHRKEYTVAASESRVLRQLKGKA